VKSGRMCIPVEAANKGIVPNNPRFCGQTNF